MIENSSAGLVMLGAELAITVTREENHQSVLARYPVAEGAQRHVAVELGWCAIGSGKYRGQSAIEVSLDGQRVGELTYLMSQRYAAVVSQVASLGGRPGCEALIQRGAKGLEVVLRLPRDADSAIPMPVPPSRTSFASPTAMTPVPHVPQRRGTFSSHRPAWIAAAVIGVFVVVAVASNDKSPSTNPAAQLGTSTAATTTTTASRTTTTVTTTSTTSTTTVAPAPEPPAPPPAPAPKVPTKQAAPPPPPPAPAPEPPPTCDPNYTGCVPIASDVDCQGGSGNGPAYVAGPIRVVGNDIYGLDSDKNGIACE